MHEILKKVVFELVAGQCVPRHGGSQCSASLGVGLHVANHRLVPWWLRWCLQGADAGLLSALGLARARICGDQLGLCGTRGRWLRTC